MTSPDTITEQLIYSGVPRRYLTAEPRPDLIGGAYIYGGVGVGKTYAACGAMRAYIQSSIVKVETFEYYDGKSVRFVNVPQWFALLRSTYDTAGQSEYEMFDKYASCGLLVLDDLGKGSKSEWAAERLYMLLDKRYADKLPTIITSNYTVSKVASMLSTDAETMQSIASRIVGSCKGVEMNGADRRVGA